MSILLIRHGETALNVARVLQPADTPLSARGIAQAAALAGRLETMGVEAIVSSDLPRALATARTIAAATGAPIETMPLLQERNFGDWRGQPYDRIPVDPLTMDAGPPGGESMAQFGDRVRLAFAHIVQRRAGLHGVLVVVTHGLVIRAMLAAHVRMTGDLVAPAHLGNTSLSVFDAAPPHDASLVNCTRHLEGALDDDAKALSGG